MLGKGDRAAEFDLEGLGNKRFSLSDFRGKWLILFFYPKDGTSG
jgi:peroxiredoxin Q/BCP